MQKISKILANAKKMQNENLIMRTLAADLNNKIKQERSIANLNNSPYLFSNIKHFEREFKLRKFEVEDVFLLRK